MPVPFSGPPLANYLATITRRLHDAADCLPESTWTTDESPTAASLAAEMVVASTPALPVIGLSTSVKQAEETRGPASFFDPTLGSDVTLTRGIKTGIAVEFIGDARLLLARPRRRYIACTL